MKRGRLPLTALRAFESAGRHLSFSRAAEELFVSQAAISRQVRELEDLLERPLFERLHRRVELTEAGRGLLRQLTSSFDAIDRKLTEIQAESGRSIVRVSSEPFFAGAWLMPRLNRFQEAHPDIDVAVDVATRLVEFRTHEADLAIRHSMSRTSWPRTQSKHLVDSLAMPMLSPALLAAGPKLDDPVALAGYTLLHEDSRDGWARWFAEAGITSIPADRGPIYADGALTTRAAALGHGVALGDAFLNADDIRSGRLVCPFRLALPFGRFFLVTPDFDLLGPAPRAFADWLLREVAACRAEMA